MSVINQLHFVFGIGVVAGYIAASIGEDGVLIVDAPSPSMAPLYKDCIQALGGNDIDFVINTLWHFDHADGDKALGPEDTWSVA